MIYQTTILIAVLLAILLFTVPRKHFLLPFILAACFIPTDQRVIIFGLDFTPLRMLILGGALRLLLRGEVRTIKWNRFDKVVFAWAFCGTVIYVIQWADMRALIYKCGVLFDVIGLYWLFRQSFRSWADVIFPFKVLAICSLIFVPFFAYEWASGSNPFAILGRVGAAVREAHSRCRASFRHPIIAGFFWATILPIFIGLSRAGHRKYLYPAATAASIFIVVATASSGPILTLLIGLTILCGYKWRQYTGRAGWGLVASVIALHIVMKAPVWHLISRVAVVPGSTGWHRYNLINQGINHFGEWAFLGCRSTAHWGWGLSDVTNQYVLEGVQGGFATLALFLVMLYMALRTFLRLSLQYQEHKQQFLAWCLFVTMLGHCVAFLGASYFGQIMMWWYMTLAIVGFLNESKGSSMRVVTVSQLLDSQR